MMALSSATAGTVIIPSNFRTNISYQLLDFMEDLASHFLQAPGPAPRSLAASAPPAGNSRSPRTPAAPPRPAATPSSGGRDSGPASGPPQEWLLLVSVAVRTREDAERAAGWYRPRWHAEDCHQVLRSGCQVDSNNHQEDG